MFHYFIQFETENCNKTDKTTVNQQTQTIMVLLLLQ